MDNAQEGQVLAMITMQLLRTLPISAASGLVAHRGYLFIVADDSHYLSIFKVEDAHHHQRVRLFAGELPDEKQQRKQQKPDLEALCLLPPSAEHPNGALLAMGSGSGTQRKRAALLPLSAEGLPSSVERYIDLAPLYNSLPFVDLNIEGAFISGQHLCLLQRGNKGNAVSALITCNLQALLAGHVHMPTHITSVALPNIGNVTLGFTDGFVLPNGCIVFSAVAEDTGDSYHDGQCVGAAIGLLNPQGELLHIQTLAQAHKIEGIAPMFGIESAIYAVTDADDPAVPASLLRVEWPAAFATITKEN